MHLITWAKKCHRTMISSNLSVLSKEINQLNLKHSGLDLLVVFMKLHDRKKIQFNQN